MNLKEFKKRIDEMYEKYGGKINIYADFTTNVDIDDTVYLNNQQEILSSENIQDITEIKNNDYEVIGITISNYIMEDNNWGEDKE